MVYTACYIRSIIFPYLGTLSFNSCVASWNVSTLKRLSLICNRHLCKAKCLFSDVCHLNGAGNNLMGYFTVTESLT